MGKGEEEDFYFVGVGREVGDGNFLLMLERAEERLMMVFLLGLLSIDFFVSERLVVIRVMEILGCGWRIIVYF